MEKELLDYDASPFTPNALGGKLLCPQCNLKSVIIEKIAVNLENVHSLITEPNMANSTERGGKAKIMTNNKDYRLGMISLFYRCDVGHKGTIELQYAFRDTYFVHRPFTQHNYKPQKK
jgi:hypothetical protein